MKFGLSDSEFELLSKIVIKPLKDAGCVVWIFGSRAMGTYQPFSDIDILYKAPQDEASLRELISRIRENSEESRLAFKVDLVRDDDLAKSYLPSVLKNRIEV